MKTQDIKIKDIKPYNKNTKKHPKTQIENVAKSIEEFGWQQPIVLDKNNVIIIGHCRYEASKLLKLETVPCIYFEGTDEEARKLRIIDNKTNESEWDLDFLMDEFKTLDFSEFDIDWGIQLEEEKTEVVEDDFEIELPEEPKAKRGQIYQLGNHRLMCGDSTSEEDVKKLMNGNKAQMTFSDAPYNIAFKGSMSNTTVNGVMVKHKGANQLHGDIKNDCMNKEQFYNFMCCILNNIKLNVIGAWYLSFSSNNIEELLNPLRDNDMNWKSIIIWMKNQATLSMKDYKSRYEPIVYGRFDDKFYGEKAKEEDIWVYQRTLKNDLHPTMKPIPLICNMLKMSSKEKENVLDLFGGSGSTLIACEQLDRNCYMMELDPHYIDVIINRWEQFTGKEAVLLESK